MRQLQKEAKRIFDALTRYAPGYCDYADENGTIYSLTRRWRRWYIKRTWCGDGFGQEMGWGDSRLDACVHIACDSTEPPLRALQANWTLCCNAFDSMGEDGVRGPALEHARARMDKAERMYRAALDRKYPRTAE